MPTAMTCHQRYQAFMRFQPVDRCPLQEWRPWSVTLARWRRETGLTDAELLRFTQECDTEKNVGLDFSLQPPFEERVVAEDETSVTRADRMGVTYREFKIAPETSMPEFIGFPVKSPRDWAEVKKRLDPSTPGRYPADWEARVASWQREQPILRLYGYVAPYYGGPSLYGFVRMLVGDEQVPYAFYDEPGMVHDMMETATEFAIAMIQKALREAPVTVVQFWEDMCYRTGPLISPAMVREFMVPRYKRITEVIRKLGCDIIFLDSDGNVGQLLPLWLEAGINGIFPMEQAAGNDIRAYRQKYGRDLLMTGGIDKRVLAQDRAAIDRELALKLPLVAGGGYIPTLDHSIPPDVSFANFQYYWERKKQLLGA
ncbi:MAG: uroporphyrinogen decarboxylase family protein [Kiritimatiellae bacterium]|nr:uroporphyrinogen decarboxylase family protein [Kiritimatiellia bacterium]